jgi:hypothetical protein
METAASFRSPIRAIVLPDPISSHTRRNASGLGREVRATKGRPEEARKDG